MDLKKPKVTLRNGVEVEVWPFTIDAMERLAETEALNKVASPDVKVRYRAMREVSFEALREGMPDLTLETVGSMIDLRVFSDLLDAVAAANGWQPGKAGGGQGEAEGPSTP